MATKLTNMKITKVALCAEGACSAARINLFKVKGDTPMDFEEIIKSLPEDQQVIVNKRCAEMKKETEDAETKAKIAQDELEKVTATEPTEDDIMKSASPAMQKLFKSMQAKQAAAELVAKSLQEAETETLAKTRVSVLKSIPGEDDEKTTLLKSLNKVDATLATQVFEVLEKANAIIEKSAAFEGAGTSTAPEGGKSADVIWAEIEKAAEPIALAKSITKEAATTEVIKANGALYKSYLAALK